MRIRTIKPEFFLHEGLHEAEKATKLPLRIAFIGLWCAADREGRFKWEPRRLGVSILPYDNVEFSRVLDALTTRGFLVKYASNGVVFGAIPSFKKHQVINPREKASDLPEPAEILGSDACLTRDPRVTHACHREGKGREGNMEGKGIDASATRELAFAVFWKEYPKKKAKGEAEKAFAKVGVDVSVLLKAIEWQKRQHDWTKENGQYIPYPATWLNERRWEDEPSQTALPGMSPSAQAAADGRLYPGPQNVNVITIPDDV